MISISIPGSESALNSGSQHYILYIFKLIFDLLLFCYFPMYLYVVEVMAIIEINDLNDIFLPFFRYLVHNTYGQTLH